MSNTERPTRSGWLQQAIDESDDWAGCSDVVMEIAPETIGRLRRGIIDMEAEIKRLEEEIDQLTVEKEECLEAEAIAFDEIQRLTPPPQGACPRCGGDGGGHDAIPVCGECGGSGEITPPQNVTANNLSMTPTIQDGPDRITELEEELTNQHDRFEDRIMEKDRVLSAVWRWAGAMPPDADALAVMDDIMKCADTLDTTGEGPQHV